MMIISKMIRYEIMLGTQNHISWEVMSQITSKIRNEVERGLPPMKVAIVGEILLPEVFLEVNPDTWADSEKIHEQSTVERIPRA